MKTNLLAVDVEVVYTWQMNFNDQSIWLEINLAAIRRNIQLIIKHTNRPVMAVVKANAYGHGIIEVAKAAIEAGSIRLCVARIEEGIKIREAGIHAPILVMGYTTPERAADAVRLGISLMVNTPELASEYHHIAVGLKSKISVHAKIDTGMSRLGVFPGDGCDFGRHITGLDMLNFEGLFTHFATADDPEKPTTLEQIQKFDHVIAALKAYGIRPPIIHAANSAASLYFPGAWYDAVRPGIAIYGLNPSPEAPLLEGFEAALTWKCRLASVKTIPPHTGIGYNHRYITSKSERIGAAAVGYADGLRRRLGNIAIIGNQRVDQAGGMCMDQSMWILPDGSNAKVGDEVVLIGKQGSECITAEEIGTLWGTVNYDVVCGLTDRVPRFYIDE